MDSENPDQIVINQLIEAGSNLEKPHKIDFAFYFPTEPKANDAKVSIQELLQSTISRLEPSAYGDYLLEISKVVTPSLNTMEEFRTKLSAIASKFDGTYDGWGAMIEK